MATRAEQFDELVLDAASRMEQRAGKAFGDVEFAVEDVPPSDPAPWESSDLPLGRLQLARGERARADRAGLGVRLEDARERVGVRERGRGEGERQGAQQRQ